MIATRSHTAAAQRGFAPVVSQMRDGFHRPRHAERSRGTWARGRRGRSSRQPPRSLDYARDDEASSYVSSRKMSSSARSFFNSAVGPVVSQMRDGLHRPRHAERSRGTWAGGRYGRPSRQPPGSLDYARDDDASSYVSSRKMSSSARSFFIRP